MTLSPIEAMACGRPVIALRSGGALETVIEGKTGLFFDLPTTASLVEAIKKLEKFDIHPQEIRSHANHFSEEHFQKKLTMLIASFIEQHSINYGLSN